MMSACVSSLNSHLWMPFSSPSDFSVARRSHVRQKSVNADFQFGVHDCCSARSSISDGAQTSDTSTGPPRSVTFRDDASVYSYCIGDSDWGDDFQDEPSAGDVMVEGVVLQKVVAQMRHPMFPASRLMVVALVRILIKLRRA